MDGRNEIKSLRSNVQLGLASIRLSVRLLQETSPNAKGEQLQMCCLSG